jgi:hypothetical protein
MSYTLSGTLRCRERWVMYLRAVRLPDHRDPDEGQEFATFYRNRRFASLLRSWCSWSWQA